MLVDEIKVDRIRNLIARRGKAPRRYSGCAHDALGLMVSMVGEAGLHMLRDHRRWYERILPGMKVTINGFKGPVTGVNRDQARHPPGKGGSRRTRQAERVIHRHRRGQQGCCGEGRDNHRRFHNPQRRR